MARRLSRADETSASDDGPGQQADRDPDRAEEVEQRRPYELPRGQPALRSVCWVASATGSSVSYICPIRRLYERDDLITARHYASKSPAAPRNGNGT